MKFMRLSLLASFFGLILVMSYNHPALAMCSVPDPNGPLFSLSSNCFEFEATLEGGNPSDQTFTVTVHTPNMTTLEIRPPSPPFGEVIPDWLTITPMVLPTTGGSVNLSVDITGLAPGTHSSYFYVYGVCEDNDPNTDNCFGFGTFSASNIAQVKITIIDNPILSVDLNPEAKVLCDNGNFGLQVDATVTNNGAVPLSNVLVEVLDSGGTTVLADKTIAQLSANTSQLVQLKLEQTTDITTVNEYIAKSGGVLPPVPLKATAGSNGTQGSDTKNVTPSLDNPTQYLNTGALSVRHSPDPGNISDDPASIFIDFSPKCGNNSLPIKTLAFALGIDHFNWEQIITVPSNFEVYHLEEAIWDHQSDGSIISNIDDTNGWPPNNNPPKFPGGITITQVAVGTMHDRVVQPATKNRVYGLKIDRDGLDDIYWVFLHARRKLVVNPAGSGEDDIKETYWSEHTNEWKGPWSFKHLGNNVTSPLLTTDTVTLIDRPILPDWALKFGNPPPAQTNQHWFFTTRLVGVVDPYGPTIEPYKLVIKWKSDSVFDQNGSVSGEIGISGMSQGYIPSSSGSVFDIEIIDEGAGFIYLPLIIK